MNEKFDILNELLMDARNEYAEKVNTLIEGSLGNGDITEEEAADLRAIY